MISKHNVDGVIWTRYSNIIQRTFIFCEYGQNYIVSSTIPFVKYPYYSVLTKKC